MSASLNAGVNSLDLVIDPPKDQYTQALRDDLQYTKVWCSTTSGFTPAAGNLVYQGPSLSVTIPNLTAGTTYYVKYSLISELEGESVGADNIFGTGDDTYIVSSQLSAVPIASNGIIGELSSYSIILPVDSTGAITSYTGASTVLSIYNGTSDDSANWTYSVTKTNVTCTEASTSRTQTVTALTAPVGYVDFVASKTGYTNITKRYTVTKATAGAAGAGTYTLNFTSATYGSDRSTVVSTRQFDGWDAQAYSTQSYVNSVYCSARSTDNGNYFGFGLDSAPTTDTHFISIDYAWYAAGTDAAIYESGTQQTSFEAYTTDTVFSIVYDGSNVRYYRDGVLKRTVARSTGAALYFDSALYKPGKGLKDIVFGPGGVAGTTGATGAAGASAVIAYKVETNATLPAAPTSASAGWPTSTGYGSWSNAPPATPLGVNEWLFQAAGTYNGSTYTWTSPSILSTFKVGALSALTVNTGALTVSDSLTVGASGNIKSGKTSSTDTNAGFFLGSESSTTKFAIGDSNASFDWDGIKLKIRGYIDGGATGGLTIGSMGSNTINAGSFIPGYFYKILTIGTTSWTSIGASSNAVGTVFQATGAGSGTGTATLLYTNNLRLSSSIDNLLSISRYYSDINQGPILPLIKISDSAGGSPSFTLFNEASPGNDIATIGASGSSSIALTTSVSGTTSTALSVSQTGTGDGSYGLVVNTATDNSAGANLISATGSGAVGLVVKSTGANSGSAKFFNTGNTSNSKAVTFTASTNKVNATAHGYANGTAVVFSGISGGGGITAGTVYYVKNTATNDFEVSVSPVGTTLDITSDGSATAGVPRQFWAAPGGYAAYSPPDGGKYKFYDGVGAFTGYHNVLVPKTTNLDIGKCLVDNELILRLDINNTLFSAKLSSQPEQPGVIGIVSAIGELDDLTYLPDYLRNQYQQTHWFVDVNALGEGQILVSGKAGSIQKGDLLAAGAFGIAQKQISDQVFKYTVARAREAVIFNNENEVKLVACIYMCG